MKSLNIYIHGMVLKCIVLFYCLLKAVVNSSRNGVSVLMGLLSVKSEGD